MIPFPMKTQKIQAVFARKRDADNLRIERTTETNRYFDHWGKVTSRYQTWTTPEYYENANEIMRKSKEQQIKDIKINERREKLQILLNNEKQMYENELTTLITKKPSAIMKRQRNGRLDNITTNFLEKIHGNVIDNNDERRRIELESKLYSRWRNQPPGDDNGGGCGTSICSDYTNDDSVKGCLNNLSRVESRCRRPLDDNALFDSKNDHETMAKLNWLDKQIDNQMKREQEAKESELRNLQIQEEQRKYEETLKERHKIRESEIKELRAIQEYHVQELKQRETETNNLQSNEIYLRNTIDTIQSELLKLVNREENLKKLNINISSSHNVNKVKMIFRQRATIYHQELQNDIDRLKRILMILNNIDPELDEIIIKYKKQLFEEHENQSQIQTMYESEAKYNLKKWEEIWLKEFYIRQKNLYQYFDKRKSLTEQQLTDNLKHQKDLIEIREKHLSAIENSNDKLKLLINENDNKNNIEICQDNNIKINDLNDLNDDKMNNSARSIKSNESFGNGRNSSTYKRSFGFNWIDNDDNQIKNCEKNNNFIEFTSKKFNNCNLNDGNDDRQNENGPPNNLQQQFAPKFGKKKIAWT